MEAASSPVPSNMGEVLQMLTTLSTEVHEIKKQQQARPVNTDMEMEEGDDDDEGDWPEPSWASILNPLKVEPKTPEGAFLTKLLSVPPPPEPHQCHCKGDAGIPRDPRDTSTQTQQNRQTNLLPAEKTGSSPPFTDT
jgi:hypothetical protein